MLTIRKTSVIIMRIFAMMTFLSSELMANPSLTSRGTNKETHPFQQSLKCVKSKGDVLKGELFLVDQGKETSLGIFKRGHVGSCEFAIRHSRNNKVCIEVDSNYRAIELPSRAVIKQFANDIKPCLEFSKDSPALVTKPGYVQFIPDRELAVSLKHLPQVSDPEINSVLRAPTTMWYDEESMIFSYQDSFGNPTGPEGLRANRVGFDVGSTSNRPDIRLLTEYFEHGRFKFPFAINAGADFQSNTYTLNFWAPPYDASGIVKPVIWWLNRSHWHWLFPSGTVLGEVLLLRESKDSEWFVHEVRSRTRQLDKWKTDIFRPFATASDFAAAVKEARPDWQNSDLGKLVQHLEDQGNLVPAKLQSTPYKAIFPDISGFYDVLPSTQDANLIESFLGQRTFVSVMNRVWKENTNGKSYAPTTADGFNIVPKGYIGGLLETSERGCETCHNQTSRPLGQLNSKLVLYGEVWGEDQVFTWHPFQVTHDIFTVSDGSRVQNPRFVEAGLIEKRKPTRQDDTYKELPRVYPAVYK